MNGVNRKRKRLPAGDTDENFNKKAKLTAALNSSHQTVNEKVSQRFNSDAAKSSGISVNNEHKSSSNKKTVPHVSDKSSNCDKKAVSVKSSMKVLTGQQKSSLSHKSGGVSTNWKELLKSGEVSYKKKTELKVKIASVTVEKPPDIWFDDVDEILLDLPKSSSSSGDSLVKANSFEGVTNIIGMDCEMVGVGEDGKDSILARVSIVNHFGHCIYDKFVKPTEKVTDYRTHVSGVRPADLIHGEDFKTVQQEVADLMKGRVLVGHALHNDLKVLFLSHPRKDLRDTAQYKPFRQAVGSGRPSLKKLAATLLGVEVQQGEHSSIQDAQAAMKLYTLHRKDWEKSLKMRRHHKSSEAIELTEKRKSKKKDKKLRS